MYMHGDYNTTEFFMEAIIVHGGAYSIPDSTVAKCRSGCSEAAEKAYLMLKAGKSAVDAGMKVALSYPRDPLCMCHSNAI